jgi:hypothetical protein
VTSPREEGEESSPREVASPWVSGLKIIKVNNVPREGGVYSQVEGRGESSDSESDDEEEEEEEEMRRRRLAAGFLALGLLRLAASRDLSASSPVQVSVLL